MFQNNKEETMGLLFHIFRNQQLFLWQVTKLVS